MIQVYKSLEKTSKFGIFQNVFVKKNLKPLDEIVALIFREWKRIKNLHVSTHTQKMPHNSLDQQLHCQKPMNLPLKNKKNHYFNITNHQYCHEKHTDLDLSMMIYHTTDKNEGCKEQLKIENDEKKQLETLYVCSSSSIILHNTQ